MEKEKRNLTEDEKKARKAVSNKKHKKGRFITPEQRAARDAYGRVYSKRPDVKARNSERFKVLRKKVTIEEKRQRFILKGRPIPPRYMTDSELLIHKEADMERRRMSERKRVECNEYKEKKRLADLARLENKEAREKKRANDRNRAKRPDVAARNRSYRAGRPTASEHRARHYGVRMEKVDPIVVFERDGWVCCDCGIVVVRSRHYVSNRASIDHTIPLSKGGSHTYDNVRTLCVVCNSIKCDKVVGECVVGTWVSGRLLIHTNTVIDHVSINSV